MFSKTTLKTKIIELFHLLYEYYECLFENQNQIGKSTAHEKNLFKISEQLSHEWATYCLFFVCFYLDETDFLLFTQHVALCKISISVKSHHHYENKKRFQKHKKPFRSVAIFFQKYHNQ